MKPASLLDEPIIEIRKTANGVIVAPAHGYGSRDVSVHTPTEWLVFDSKEAFAKWIAGYFPKGGS